MNRTCMDDGVNQAGRAPIVYSIDIFDLLRLFRTCMTTWSFIFLILKLIYLLRFYCLPLNFESQEEFFKDLNSLLRWGK